MTYADKLKVLQKVTEKTQTELAGLLGVSFPTLNSWLNAKSTPRKQHGEKIDLLYQEYTGAEKIDDSELAQKKQQIAQLQKTFPNPLKLIMSRKDLYDSFVLELTYHTNSIEGSTFSEPEVKAVLFDNAVIPDKTVVEHQEAKNHQAALANLFQRLNNSYEEPTMENDIKKLHSILMNGIYPNAGHYRNHAVRIAGSRVVTANHLKIEELMNDFIKNTNKKPANVFSHLAENHAQFEHIHPFSDGNGRVGRLLMHSIAIRHGLPPISIKRDKKQAYYTYLERAQTKNESIFLESFICESILQSYKLLS
ncbi:MAG: Fic family protein [bacterium]|nr:Fic family protein [bacterium]